MSGVPSRQARLAHAAKHAELWNAGDREGWIASWRTIATGDPYDVFQPILKIPTPISLRVSR
jgi:hypothetical protein